MFIYTYVCFEYRWAKCEVERSKTGSNPQMLSIDRSNAVTPALFNGLCYVCCFVMFYAVLIGNWSQAVNKAPGAVDDGNAVPLWQLKFHLVYLHYSGIEPQSYDINMYTNF